MFENPRRGRQASSFTTNVPKILDLKSSSEQIFSENCRWVPLVNFCLRRRQLLPPSKPIQSVCQHFQILAPPRTLVKGFESLANFCLCRRQLLSPLSTFQILAPPRTLVKVSKSLANFCFRRRQLLSPLSTFQILRPPRTFAEIF